MSGTIDNREVKELKALEESLRGMTPDIPPPGLDMKILEAVSRLPAPKRPLWRRLVSLSERPAVVLAYRLVSLAVLVGILAGVWNIVAMRRGTTLNTTAAAGPYLVADRGQKQPAKGTSVTFVLYAPEAKSVAVVGNFNDWDSGKLQMTRGKDGSWTAQITLSPGQYEYQFVVDGSRFVPDPNALEQRDDGMGGANAVLRL